MPKGSSEGCPKRPEQKIEQSRMTWDGVGEIRIQYTKSWGTSHEELYGVALDHIELQVLSPDSVLPVTKTGYRSHFVTRNLIDERGGYVGYVQMWLDTVAEEKGWRKGLQSRESCCDEETRRMQAKRHCCERVSGL